MKTVGLLYTRACATGIARDICNKINGLSVGTSLANIPFAFSKNTDEQVAMYFKNTVTFLGAAAVATVVASGTAMAAPTIFFGEDVAGESLPVPNSAAAEADFLSNLSGVETEDFEGFTDGETFPLVVTFGPSTATLSGTTTIGNTGISDGNIAGRFAISGSQYLNVGTDDANSFTLTFSQPQAAFGFYGTDIGDIDGQLALTFDGTTVIDVPHTVNAANGNALYFGIIDVDNPFTTITFSSGVLNDAFGFDDFTIGTQAQVVTTPSVPEPATLTLFGLGGVGLLALRRRRRTS